MAAKLASSFGVYGTIAGAGLISVVATCGGSVLQHFFKRTGEQIRVKRTVAAVRIDGRTASVPAATPDPNPASASGDFTEGTVYRTRTRGWRRPLVAAALVFGVTMAGITVYEVASGQNLSGGHSTTVGSAFTGHGKSAADSGESGESGDSGGTEDPRTAGTPATRATRTTPVPGAKPRPPPLREPGRHRREPVVRRRFDGGRRYGVQPDAHPGRRRRRRGRRHRSPRPGRLGYGPRTRRK